MKNSSTCACIYDRIRAVTSGLTSRMKEMASLSVIESNVTMTTKGDVIPQDNHVFVNFIPFYLDVQKKGAIRIVQ